MPVRSARLGFAEVSLNRQLIAAAAAAGTLALACGLVLGGWLWMPAVTPDDLAFSGPAIRFATTGEMRAFLYDWWRMPASELPFWYTPIHFYVFGFWLKVFGCSTPSALCFYAATAAVCTAGISLALARLGCSPLWCCGGALLSWTTFYGATQFGLRPEPVALAFLFIGLPLIPSLRSPIRCLGFLLCGLAGITAPRVLPWVAALVAFFGVARLDRPRALLANALIGGVLALLLFGVSIGFKFAEFYRVFSVPAAMFAPQPSFAMLYARLGSLMGQSTEGYGALNWFGMAAVLIAGASAAWPFARAAAPLLLTFAIGFVVALPVTQEAPTTVVFVYVMAMGLWGIPIWPAQARWLRRSVVVACIALTGLPLILISRHFFAAKYRSPAVAASYREIEAAARSRPWRTLWIDGFALRFVFDMKPPNSAKRIMDLRQQVFDLKSTDSANEHSDLRPGRGYDRLGTDSAAVVSPRVERFSSQRGEALRYDRLAAPPIYFISRDRIVNPPTKTAPPFVP